MGKKLSPLEKGIVNRPLPDGLISRAMAEGKRSREFKEKVRLLFAKYQVQNNNWMDLAITLAIAHEVGFKLIAQPGPPKGKSWLWTPERDMKLVQGIELLIQNKPKISRNAACALLCTNAVFKGQTSGALRRRLWFLKNKNVVGRS